MARHDVGATFSDIWYRVAPTRPRVSPHAQFVRHERSDAVTYIVEEPASGNFYRLSETAYFFLGLLNGARSVGDAWDVCNAQLGDDAPTQRECIDLLSQLQLYGLLLGDLPLEADMVLERLAERRKMRLKQRTGRWLFPNIPLVNPERLLARHRVVIGHLFSRPALVAWLLLVGVAVGLVISNRGELVNSFKLSSLLAPGAILQLTVLFILLRALHEFGHAAACKAFGGRVTEIGVILIAYVLPIPYCDATSSWRFPSTTHRVIVAAGGIYLETILAAICAIVWAFTNDETAPLLRSLCYQTMILSGVTTAIFNLNPLLRYDGYYMLSDATATPNLAQRSRDLWRYGLHKFAFGVKGLTPPATRDASEQTLLWVFGAFSTPYRFLIMFAIFMIILTQYPGIGIIIGVVVGVMWLVWPVVKGIGHLASSPKLVGHRARAITVTLGTIVLVIVSVGFVPAPAASYASGTIEPAVLAPVRTGTEGFIESVVVRGGTDVRAGDALVVLRNDTLRSRLDAAEARVESERAALDLAATRGLSDRRIAEKSLAYAMSDRDRIASDVERLVVRAPADGAFLVQGETSGALENAIGRFAARGTLLAHVASLDDLVVRVSMPDREQAHAFRSSAEDPSLGRQNVRSVAIRARGSAGTVVDGRISNLVPKATRELANDALSTQAGGSITPDPDQADGSRTLSPHVLIELAPERSPASWYPGLRARVRFGLPSETLFEQWGRRARQYIRSRLG